MLSFHPPSACYAVRRTAGGPGSASANIAPGGPCRRKSEGLPGKDRASSASHSPWGDRAAGWETIPGSRGWLPSPAHEASLLTRRARAVARPRPDRVECGRFARPCGDLFPQFSGRVASAIENQWPASAHTPPHMHRPALTPLDAQRWRDLLLLPCLLRAPALPMRTYPTAWWRLFARYACAWRSGVPTCVRALRVVAFEPGALCPFPGRAFSCPRTHSLWWPRVIRVLKRPGLPPRWYASVRPTAVFFI